jgi:GNAT superfamily N-acetyltransferase
MIVRYSEKSKEKPVPRFEKATSGDVPELTGVMTRAFDDDSRRFRGKLEGCGPPGYNTGEFLRKWMKEGICYKMTIDGIAVGAFIVFVEEDGNNVLATIFIDPEFQNLGIGTEAIRFIEETYPNARRWRLGTPEWATRNHHFYEKCGFKKIGEERNVEEGFIGFLYEKIMK